MNPIVSVVVPTKNRYKYLKHLINLIVSFKSNEIELVIQDNSDNNNEIIKYLDGISSQSIKYFYCSEKLSMSENSDLAVHNSTGEYICFIGDDDGVSRNIIDCVKWMKRNGFDSLRSSRVDYNWGDYNKSKHSKDMSQTLLYNQFSLTYKFVDAKKELNRILRKGLQTVDEIPMLYNSIVRKDVLNEIYNIGNTFFPGASPDISNGIALCFYVKKYVVIDLPVVISGASMMTGGGIYKRKGRTSRLEDVGFISKNVIDNWEENIPRIWAGRLAWPESGVKALRYLGKEDYLKYMNYNYMFAAFSVYYSQFFRTAFEYSPNKLLFLFYLLVILFSSGTRVLKNKIVSLLSQGHAYGKIIEHEIKDINEAEQYIHNIIGENCFEKLKLIMH